MRQSTIRVAVLAALLAVGAAILACSGDDQSGTATSPILGDGGVVPPGDAGVQSGLEVGNIYATSVTPIPYDSNRAMHDVFPWHALMSVETNQTFEEIAREGDRSLVPVLVEILQYMPTEAAQERVATTTKCGSRW